MIDAGALHATVKLGADAHTSALYWLTSSEQAQALLLNHESLRKQISEGALNHIIASGKNAGKSALFWLAHTEMGCMVLAADNSALIGMINRETLLSKAETGAYAGTSALFFLVANDDGRQIILKHPSLLNKISKEELNRVINSGAQTGRSV